MKESTVTTIGHQNKRFIITRKYIAVAGNAYQIKLQNGKRKKNHLAIFYPETILKGKAMIV